MTPFPAKGLSNISARDFSGGLAFPAFSTGHWPQVMGHWPLSSSVQRRNRVPLIPPPTQIVHCNVQVNFAARRLDADHQRFRLRASAEPLVTHVDFRRKHFEVK